MRRKKIQNIILSCFCSAAVTAGLAAAGGIQTVNAAESTGGYKAAVLETDLSSYSEFNWIDSYEEPDPGLDVYSGDHEDSGGETPNIEEDPIEEETNVIAKYYPRVRKVGDFYVLFYETTQTGGDIYYTTSKNLKDWTTPQIAWEHTVYKDVENQDILDGMVFSNCDMLVMENGRLFVYASYHSSNLMATHPELNGIIFKTGSLGSDGKIKWDGGENDTVTTSTGEIVNMGGKIVCSNTCAPWEPSAIKYGNTIIMTYTESIKTSHISSMPHSPSCTGVVVSYDNGKTWSKSMVMTRKYIGQFTGVLKELGNKTKKINYYTSQMPQGVRLKNGNLFYTYEMYTTSDQWGVPEGYSIGASIYGKDYDFSKASGIAASSLYNNSIKSDAVTGDPLGKKDSSGNVKQLFSLIAKGTAPDILQFPSGEIAVSYSMPSRGFMRLSLFDDSSEPEALDDVAVLASGWGSIESVDDRSVLAVSTTADYEAVTFKKVLINRSHDAVAYKNGATDKEAFFVGSDSDANARVSFFETEKELIIQTKRTDSTPESGDRLTVSLADEDNITHDIVITPDSITGESLGIKSGAPAASSNGKVTTGEIRIDKSKLAGGQVRVFLSVDDPGGDSTEDTMGNTIHSDPSGWPAVSFAAAQGSDEQPEKPGMPKSVSSNCTPNGKQRIVMWSEVPGADEYIVEYKESGDSKWTRLKADGNSTRLYYNAKVRAKYQIRVAAVNRSADGSKEAVGDFRYDVRETAGRYHKSVINPKYTKSGNSITFTWDRDASATGYQIIYRKAENSKPSVATINKNTILKRVISGLEKGTYYVRYRPYVIEKGITYYGIQSKRITIVI